MISWLWFVFSHILSTGYRVGFRAVSGQSRRGRYGLTRGTRAAVSERSQGKQRAACLQVSGKVVLDGLPVLWTEREDRGTRALSDNRLLAERGNGRGHSGDVGTVGEGPGAPHIQRQ